MFSKHFVNKCVKNFSLFNRLKDYMKSSGAENLSSNINPDLIKAEYEEVDKIYKKNLKKMVGNEKEEKYPVQIIDDKDKKLIDELVSKIEQSEISQEIKSLKMTVRYKTIWEKLDSYETNNIGKFVIPLLKDDNLIFDSYEQYYEWRENKKKELKEKIFNKLTPMEYYITQEKGTERPFTGDYWDTNKVGVYSCKVCTQRIFSSTHKYNSKSGHATFWNFLPYTLNFHEDFLDFPQPTQAIYRIPFINNKPTKRIVCSHCDSHLGHVFDDGVAPFFKRLNINSAAIQFQELLWFESPDEKKMKKELNILIDQQKKILFDNTRIQRMSKEMPELFEYIDKNIVPVERDLNNDKIVSSMK